VLFPAIVTLAVASEPRPPSAKVFAWLGSVSYPLYALHKPAGELVTLWVRHVAPREITNVWVGAIYLTIAVVICALVEHVYDIPVRRLLTALLDRVTGYAPAKPSTQASGALAADTRS
jgi:peptidoglycan/LPS O-acetylase OafA/YrhL